MSSHIFPFHYGSNAINSVDYRQILFKTSIYRMKIPRRKHSDHLAISRAPNIQLLTRLHQPFSIQKIQHEYQCMYNNTPNLILLR